MQTDASIEILADLPGVSKGDVELDIDKDTVIIGVRPATAPTAAAQNKSDACEKDVKSTEAGKQDVQPADAQKPPETSAKPEEEKPRSKVLRKERSQCFAKRALKLPETADLTRTDASLTDGVLRIVVSKKELPSPKRIRIA